MGVGRQTINNTEQVTGLVQEKRTTATGKMEPGKRVRTEGGGADGNVDRRWWPLRGDFVNAFQSKTNQEHGAVNKLGDSVRKCQKGLKDWGLG